jgi:hypothetical protein
VELLLFAQFALTSAFSCLALRLMAFKVAAEAFRVFWTMAF